MDAGPVVVDAGAPDAGTLDACEARDETCNLLDDDCDGVVDEEADATCVVAGGVGLCQAGVCVIGVCDEGRGDCDGAYDTGCPPRVRVQIAGGGASRPRRN